MTGYPIQQGSANSPLVFLMVDSADHISPKTGLSPTVTLSKNGGAFGVPAGAVFEVGNGLYRVVPNAADSGTLGPLILHATATGADPVDFLYMVVAFNPLSATNLGLSALPTANPAAVGGLPTADASNGVKLSVGTGAGQLNLSGGKAPATVAAADVAGNVAADVQTIKTQAVACAAGVTINVNVGTTQPVNFTGTAATALVRTDTVDIAGAAVNAATAQLGVNVVNIKGTASAGAAGYVGLDWGHITAPTTAVALAGTTIGDVTVGGYATGQGPATLVLDALAADHDAPNTVGEAIGAAGGGGGLTVADVQAALTTQGYTTARAALLDHLNADINSRMATFTYVAPDNADIASILAAVTAGGGGVTVAGYAAGQDPASYLLVEPANRLATDATGKVTAATVQTVNLPVLLDLGQALVSPRDVGTAPDDAMSLNDALWGAVVAAGGQRSAVGTTLRHKSPAGTIYRTFLMDDPDNPHTIT